MPILPMLREGQLIDGSYIHLLPFCKNEFAKGKCKTFYATIASKKPGFYTCPYGLSVLVFEKNGHKSFFTCLRERTTYKKKIAKITQSDSKTYNPLLDSEQLISLAQETLEIQCQQESLVQKNKEVDDLLHETCKLNGQIKTICDLIWENINSGNEYDIEDLLSKIQDIHICSYIIFNRFQYFDTVLNPGLSMGEPVRAIVFKKFDKMRKLLKGYMHKNVWISIESKSTFSYNLYPTFETLLFVLLENAIKYAPNHSPITVTFDEKDDGFHALIQSEGPYCSKEELSLLGAKGFRAKNAQLTGTPGQGFGLNFAHKICEMHGIEISYSSRYGKKDHGIVYGTFSVLLKFPYV